MYYCRKEEYNFVIPKEFNAYLAFKDELKQAGVTFHEEGGNRYQTIIIYTRGNFENPGEIYKSPSK